MEDDTTPHSARASLDALLELFDTDLARVSFPDVTGASLREAAESVEIQRLAVVEAEAALREARDAHEASRGAYERLGRRALAYARIYADGDSELGARLATITRGLDGGRQDATSDAPRKRGRPRKSDASLFEVDAIGSRSNDLDTRVPSTDDEDLLAESA